MRKMRQPSAANRPRERSPDSPQSGLQVEAVQRQGGRQQDGGLCRAPAGFFKEARPVEDQRAGSRKVGEQVQVGFIKVVGLGGFKRKDAHRFLADDERHNDGAPQDLDFPGRSHFGVFQNIPKLRVRLHVGDERRASLTHGAPGVAPGGGIRESQRAVVLVADDRPDLQMFIVNQ